MPTRCVDEQLKPDVTCQICLCFCTHNVMASAMGHTCAIVRSAISLRPASTRSPLRLSRGEDLVSADDVAAAKEDPEEQTRQIDPARAARCRTECSCRESCGGSCAHGHQ